MESVDWEPAVRDAHEIANHTRTHPCCARHGEWVGANALERSKSLDAYYQGEIRPATEPIRDVLGGRFEAARTPEHGVATLSNVELLDMPSVDASDAAAADFEGAIEEAERRSGEVWPMPVFHDIPAERRRRDAIARGGDDPRAVDAESRARSLDRRSEGGLSTARSIRGVACAAGGRAGARDQLRRRGTSAERRTFGRPGARQGDGVPGGSTAKIEVGFEDDPQVEVERPFAADSVILGPWIASWLKVADRARSLAEGQSLKLTSPVLDSLEDPRTGALQLTRVANLAGARVYAIEDRRNKAAYKAKLEIDERGYPRLVEITTQSGLVRAPRK